MPGFSYSTRQAKLGNRDMARVTDRAGLSSGLTDRYKMAMGLFFPPLRKSRPF